MARQIEGSPARFQGDTAALGTSLTGAAAPVTTDPDSRGRVDVPGKHGHAFDGALIGGAIGSSIQTDVWAPGPKSDVRVALSSHAVGLAVAF
jgi:hypothetical protein